MGEGKNFEVLVEPGPLRPVNKDAAYFEISYRRICEMFPRNSSFCICVWFWHLWCTGDGRGIWDGYLGWVGLDVEDVGRVG